MKEKERLRLDVRRQKIIDLLNRDGKVKVSDLSNWLNASQVTIRNDLDYLGQKGYLERMPGGAVMSVKNYYLDDFHQRQTINADLKKQIARATADLVRDGETLMINSGTTTLLTAVELKKRKNLSILTNSVAVALELGTHPTFRIILLGGKINPQYAFTYGGDALAQLEKYKADKAILSVDGVCYGIGLSTNHAEEAELNKSMITRSRQTVVVADKSKLGKESFFNFSSLSEIDYLVTNRMSDENQLLFSKSYDIKIVSC